MRSQKRAQRLAVSQQHHKAVNSESSQMAGSGVGNAAALVCTRLHASRRRPPSLPIYSSTLQKGIPPRLVMRISGAGAYVSERCVGNHRRDTQISARARMLCCSLHSVPAPGCTSLARQRNAHKKTCTHSQIRTAVWRFRVSGDNHYTKRARSMLAISAMSNIVSCQNRCCAAAPRMRGEHGSVSVHCVTRI